MFKHTMGLFNKKKKVKKISMSENEVPQLPRLDLPKFKEPIHQLPQLPSNSVGERFSQNSIKESVAGGKEDELEEEDFEQISSPLSAPRGITEEISEPPAIRTPTRTTNSRTKSPKEPIFVRIDKFEEGLEIFEKSRDKIHEMEKILQDIKKLKDEEQKEIEMWEQEISTMKSQIEKVDKDIFSRIK